MTEIDYFTKKLLSKKKFNTINSFYDIGYFYYGPIVFNFLIWLKNDNIQSYDKILFNSREGYFLKKIYAIIENKYKLPNSFYFKTSRKISTNASFINEDDIYNSFKYHRYKGTLSSLLKNRFGLDVSVEKDFSIDTTKKIPNLENYIEKVLTNSIRLRKDYGKYVNSICKPYEKIMMVDYGYQGTIQFNLQKAFNLQFEGRYFIYDDNLNLTNAKGFYDSKNSFFFKNSAFFESIFTDKVGSYIDMKNNLFINEIYNKNYAFFYEKKQIIEGVKSFVRDIISFPLTSFNVDYKYADENFNKMFIDDRIKNKNFFDIFYHENFYVRNNIIKLIYKK